MTGTALLTALRDHISEEESQRLRTGDALPISDFNRRTVLALLDAAEPVAPVVSAAAVNALWHALEAYLAAYLPAQPEAWKWIILSCIYLGPLCGKPFHPQEAVRYTTEHIDGKPVYRCPMRTLEPGSVCAFCVCQAV